MSEPPGSLTHTQIHTLSEAIRAWRKGDPVPELLVAFPHPTEIFHCGICASGQNVEYHIYFIEDPDLLDALVLNPRTDDVALGATIRQILRMRGLAGTATFMAETLSRRPELAARPSFGEVLAHLKSSCIRLNIARFDKDKPVPLDHAWSVIRSMESELRAGDEWKEAYGRASETLKNEAEHKPGQAFWGPTHLSYAFSGSATPNYWDFIGAWDLRTDQYASIPAGHLEVVFEAKGGTHVLDSKAAIWLYHVEEYFAGMDLSRSSTKV